MDLATYEAENRATLDRRIAWWREAKLGLFIHYGIYSCYGRGEWIKLREGISREEYIRTADTQMTYKRGMAEEWARCAVDAGMRYAILTTQHHDGFSLWDSKVNPYNSVNYGPRIDIVREFCEACRKYDLKIGLYYSLVNWEHPDGGRCRTDEAARVRFVADVKERVRELMTNYGKIDMLWYDVALPLETAEAWESLDRNRMVRALQPDILINERSRLPEDFAISEDKLVYPPSGTEWEACMRFSQTGFGGVDHDRARPYAMNAHDIVKLMAQCQFGGGNLVFNISPNGDGSIDTYERETLATVGRWVKQHAEAVYGKADRGAHGANGICTSVRKGNRVYLWNWIHSETMRINGYQNAPQSVRCITTGKAVDFHYEGGVLHLDNLPAESPDPILHFAVYELDFGAEAPHYALIPPNLANFMNV